MKYILKLIISGDFPGSPDTDSVDISEDVYNRLWDEFFRGNDE